MKAPRITRVIHSSHVTLMAHTLHNRLIYPPFRINQRTKYKNILYIPHANSIMTVSPLESTTYINVMPYSFCNLYNRIVTLTTYKSFVFNNLHNCNVRTTKYDFTFFTKI